MLNDSPRDSSEVCEKALIRWISAFFCSHSKAWSIWVTSLATLLPIGCSSTAEMDALRSQLSEIQAQLHQLRLEASSKDEVTSLATNAQEDAATLLRSQADLRDEVRQLDQRLEAVLDADSQAAARLQEIDRRLAELQTSLDQVQDTVEQHDRATPSAALDASNPDRLYQTAYDDFLRANYDLALQGFARFLEVFPGHSLADNALYWIGECHYSRGEYQAAIREFEEVARRYPTSDRLATTLLRKAGAYAELGNRDRARTLLSNVIEQFPNSDEAVLAQQQLQALGN